MAEKTSEPSGAQKAFGDFAPAFAGFTDEVLFGQVWTRPGLSPKERSLITVAALVAGGSTEQLRNPRPTARGPLGALVQAHAKGDHDGVHPAR